MSRAELVLKLVPWGEAQSPGRGWETWFGPDSAANFLRGSHQALIVLSCLLPVQSTKVSGLGPLSSDGPPFGLQSGSSELSSQPGPGFSASMFVSALSNLARILPNQLFQNPPSSVSDHPSHLGFPPPTFPRWCDHSGLPSAGTL